MTRKELFDSRKNKPGYDSNGNWSKGLWDAHLNAISPGDAFCQSKPERKQSAQARAMDCDPFWQD